MDTATTAQNNNVKVIWLQWGLATAVVAIGAVFALMSYMHSSFTGSTEFSTHQKTVHVGAVQEQRYAQDLQDLRSRIADNGAKLDSILTILATRKDLKDK